MFASFAMLFFVWLNDIVVGFDNLSFFIFFQTKKNYVLKIRNKF